MLKKFRLFVLRVIRLRVRVPSPAHYSYSYSFIRLQYVAPLVPGYGSIMIACAWISPAASELLHL
eukprot:scaffold133422_cov14-Prasinocladus_malaysianus.AAC.1